MISKTAQKVINKLLKEIVADNPSNWGGWQGGFPGGNGSALKNLKSGTARKPMPKRKSEPELSSRGHTANALKHGGKFMKLTAKKTGVIITPTLKQTQNKLDVKNPTLSAVDNPKSPGKPYRQVKEQQVELSNRVVQQYASLHEKGDVLGSLIATGVKHLLKRAFGKSKPTKAPKGPSLGTAKLHVSPKPLSKTAQARSDLDKSNADFAAWKTHKLAMSNVFKAAHAAGVGDNINPMRVRLDKQAARAANPLKQANEPPKETPAAPTTKPRIRVQAIGRKVEPPKPQLKDRMSGKDFAAFMKSNPNIKDKIKGGSGLTKEAQEFEKKFSRHQEFLESSPTNRNEDYDTTSPSYKKLIRAAKKLNHNDFIKKHSVHQTSSGTRPMHDILPMKKLDPSELDHWKDYKTEFSPKRLERVEATRKHLNSGGTVPPLYIKGSRHENKRPMVIDGHHRFIAYALTGAKHVPVHYDNDTLTNIWKHHQKFQNEDTPTNNASSGAVQFFSPILGRSMLKRQKRKTKGILGNPTVGVAGQSGGDQS